jgi:hypothetical protein
MPPMKNCLKIDLDHTHNEKQLYSKVLNPYKTITETLQIPLLSEIEIYTTNHGFHIYINSETFKYYNKATIILMQLLCGSDTKRELFNYQRIIREPKMQNWNVLFKQKYKGNQLISQETPYKKFILQPGKDYKQIPFETITFPPQQKDQSTH